MKRFLIITAMLWCTATAGHVWAQNERGYIGLAIHAPLYWETNSNSGALGTGIEARYFLGKWFIFHGSFISSVFSHEKAHRKLPCQVDNS